MCDHVAFCGGGGGDRDRIDVNVCDCPRVDLFFLFFFSISNLFVLCPPFVGRGVSPPGNAEAGNAGSRGQAEFVMNNNDMLNSDLVHIVTNISIRNNPLSQIQLHRKHAAHGGTPEKGTTSSGDTKGDPAEGRPGIGGGHSYYAIVVDHTGIILQPGAMSMATKMYGRYSRNYKRYQLTRRKMLRHAKEDHRKLEEARLRVQEQLRATGQKTLNAYENSLLRMRQTKVRRL